MVTDLETVYRRSRRTIPGGDKVPGTEKRSWSSPPFWFVAENLTLDVYFCLIEWSGGRGRDGDLHVKSGHEQNYKTKCRKTQLKKTVSDKSLTPVTLS